MKITFYGAARTVTGSKHLITTGDGIQILLDCGLFQGLGSETDGLNRNFKFDPSGVHHLILSHAHVDHSGNIPTLIKKGFRGKIYCTPATFELCKIMLLDSAHIQENDVRYLNKRRIARGQEGIEPLYTVKDAEKSFHHFEIVGLNKTKKLEEGIEFMFTDAGHILGSAAVNLSIKDKGVTNRIFFSGDIGRYNNQILTSPQQFPQADYLICESTYGDRLHDDTINAGDKLYKVVHDTCIVNKGKVIIPAFSLGRTQEVVYALDAMTTKGILPKINVYVDSPLSTSATNIMRNNKHQFNEQIKKYMETDPDPFCFSSLTYITDVKESKKLNSLQEPCIIISASGMAEAGRIKHHIANNINNETNTILFVGYCSPDSLGGKLIAGEREVRIFGEYYPVKSKIEYISSYSAHADYIEMLKYLSCQDPHYIKKTFLVHGDYEAQLSFKEKLEQKKFRNIIIPAPESEWPLN